MKKLKLTIEDQAIFDRNIDNYGINQRAAEADAWMNSDYADSIHMLARDKDFFKSWRREGVK